MRNICVFFLTLSLTAGAAVAQTTLPTGILKGGAITLIRPDSKVSAATLGTFESAIDIFGAGFEAIDYSQFTPPQTPTPTPTPIPTPTQGQVQATMVDGCLVASFAVPTV